MGRSYNEKVIDSITKVIPDNKELIPFLEELLCLGKAAIYRRMNGYVSFSIEEVVKISQTLNLSLDYILKEEKSNKGVFDMSLIEPYDSEEAYAHIIRNYVKKIKKLRTFDNSHSYMALNLLPYMFYPSLENMTKFNIFKWLYLMSNGVNKISFSEAILSPETRKIQDIANTESCAIEETHILISPLLFQTFINDIQYFRRIDLISDTDYKNLRSELHTVLDELENMMLNGCYRNGKKVIMFLSNIDFLTSYVYFGSDNYEFVHFRICAANSIDSDDPQICAFKKNWIQCLMKVSTSISLCGELQRQKFINRQREIIGY
ncbi:MAG: helix-turn-helix transcriptional regulator [Dysgonomonas sp.]|nr:helix-turn-helix transcriptional regulator [Dysgonomonas sp.]